MYKQKGKKYLGLFIIILLVSIFGFKGQKIYSIENTEENNTTNVLVLNSYSRDYAWTSEIVDGIEGGLKTADNHVNTKIEYEDLKGYVQQYTIESFKEQYKNKGIDVVITTDYDSLNFLMSHRQEIFGKNVPVVFTGVSSKAVKNIIEENNNITGVIERLDIKNTLEQAFKISPKAKKVYFLHDRTIVGNESFKDTNEILKKLNKNVSLIDIKLDSYGNILTKIENDGIVLVSQYNRTLNGKKVNSEKIIRGLIGRSSLPIFELYDTNLTYSNGLGGSILSGEKLGEATGKLANEVLERKSAEGVSIVDGVDFINMYNYNAMNNYELSYRDVPSDSYIINSNPNEYQKYKDTIWKQTAVIAVLAVFVITMLENRRRRIKAEKLSNRREEHYKNLFDASNDGMWEYDLQTGIAILSKEWHEKLQLGKLEKKNENINTWLERVHQEDFPKLKELMDKTRSGELEGYSYEYRVLNIHGEYIWIASKGKGIKDENGKIYKLIGSHSNINIRKLHEEELNKIAFFDDVTGIANKTAFEKNFNKIILEGTKCTLLVLDLDNFKNVNSLFGHSIGDKFLLEVANKLKKYIRHEDMVARFAADEFLILINGIVEKKRVRLYIENILNELEETVSVDEFNMVIPASIGVARYPFDGKSFGELFKNAGNSLHRAKTKGKKTYVFFEECINSDIMKEVEVEEALRIAIEKNEFLLNFQPKYNIEKSKIDGFEALIRLNSSKFGFVSPVDFINIAERTGLIIPIGRWILETACDFIKNLEEKGYSGLTVAVNISVVQLMQNDFVDIIKEVIAESGISESSIELEITESILMQSVDNNIPKIQELKDLGMSIAIDDFGTGYSSFNYLRDIPGDVLKIDKSFINQILPEYENQVKGKTIVGTIIQLAHHMNFKVVAEGVETKEQYDYLKENNCDIIQGYYIAKPLIEKDAIDILSKNIHV